MKLQRIFRFYFGRNVKKEQSFQELEQFKCRNLEKYIDLYESDDKFQHQDKLYEEFVYGHSIHIAAVTPFNFQSLKFAKSVMKYANPNLLILGGISDNFCRAWQNVLSIPQRYEHPLLKVERMQCKQRLNKLIQARLVNDTNFIWNSKKKQALVIDHVDKRIVPHEYLTVSQMASLEDHTKIAFGKPSDSLVFEDLIIRFSVEELKGITERAISKVMERQSDSVDWRMSYTRQAIQNYVMSEQSSVYSRQVTYQAALLKRYAKIENNILLLCPGYFVQRIAEQVHHIDISPDTVFRNGLSDRNSQSYVLLQKVLEKGPQQVLQKFALICLLRQNWIENQFARGVNVFKYMCFSSLFENMSIQQLHARYDEARKAVEGKWYDLIRQRVNNVHILPRAHIRMTLSEQFNILEERATKHFPYAYEQKNYLSEHENKIKLLNLQARMRQILQEEGDKHNIQLFQKFMSGQRSRQGIILYSKLIGKANVEAVDRIKFPVFHYAAFRGIYKQYLRDFLLKAQDKNKIDQKIHKRFDRLEQMMKENLKKLDDPDELHDYVTGKKGKVMNISLDPDDGPQFSQEDIDHLQSLYGEMSAEDEKLMKEQYGEDWNKPQEQK